MWKATLSDSIPHQRQGLALRKRIPTDEVETHFINLYHAWFIINDWYARICIRKITKGSRAAKLSPLECRKVIMRKHHGLWMCDGCGFAPLAPPYCVEEIVQDWRRQVCQGRPSGKGIEKDDMENQSTLEWRLEWRWIKPLIFEWNILKHYPTQSPREWLWAWFSLCPAW